ncbi:hypothetical protein U1Q18_014377 [Sarracenia purpurea var. burkii]
MAPLSWRSHPSQSLSFDARMKLECVEDSLRWGLLCLQGEGMSGVAGFVGCCWFGLQGWASGVSLEGRAGCVVLWVIGCGVGCCGVVFVRVRGWAGLGICNNKAYLHSEWSTSCQQPGFSPGLSFSCLLYGGPSILGLS